ncbi:MAG: Uma2 family endonuclease [Dehalococcoidia bacterium]
MTAAPTLVPPKLTADEFLLSAESDGFELVDGVVEEVAMGSESSWLGGELHGRLREFVRAGRLGLVFPQESGITIWPGDPFTVRKPDVLFVRRDRVPAGGIPKGWLSVVPDLVVEVVSPRENAGALQGKLFDYRRAGVPLIWVIYPDPKSAVVWRGESVELVPADGVLDGGDVLPGFRLSLRDLFEAAGEFV